MDAAPRELARAGDLSALRANYRFSSYLELEDLSSTDLWDDLDDYEVVPVFRVRRLRAVADRVLSRARVLDIGVGRGEIIPMLRKSGVRDYVDIDYFKKVVAQAAAGHPDCQIYVGGLEQSDETSDAVLAFEVCGQILACRIFVFNTEIRRGLRADEMLMVATPVLEDLKASTPRYPKCDHMRSRIEHVQSYTLEKIQTGLALAVFKVIDSFLVYASVDNTLVDRVKRAMVVFERILLKNRRTYPRGIVLPARPR